MPAYLQQSLPGFPASKKAIEVLSKREAVDLLDFARKGLFRDFLMIETALYTGIRCAELIGLNFEHIMADGKISRRLVITRDIGKGGKAREIHLHPGLYADLGQYVQGLRGRGWPTEPWCPLFFSQKGSRRLSTRDFQRITRRTGLQAIDRAVNPHMLRHTFATRLLENSNLRIVQLALGHEAITSTQIYVHPSTDEMAQAVNALSGPGSPRQEGGGDGR